MKRTRSQRHDGDGDALAMSQMVAGDASLEGGVLALEVDTLLAAVRVDYDRLELVETALFRLKERVEAMPTTKVHARSDRLPGLPLRSREAAAMSIQAAAPTRVDVLGSFLLRTQAKPAVHVDLGLEMPAETMGLEARDIKNYLYHDKRALYLTAVSQWMEQCDWVDDVHVEPLGRVGSRPVLVLTLDWTLLLPQQQQQTIPSQVRKVTFRLIPTVPDGVFRPQPLQPHWNNVRNRARPANDDKDNDNQPATPHYTATVAADIDPRDTQASIHASLTECPVAVAAVILLKAWARRRGLFRTPEGISGFLWSALVAALVQRGVIVPMMTVAQSLRAAFRWLADTDFAREPIVLGSVDSSREAGRPAKRRRVEVQESDDEEGESEESSEEEDQESGSDESDEEGDDAESSEEDEESGSDSDTGRPKRAASVSRAIIESFQAQFPLVLLEPRGRHNLAAFVSRDSLEELQQEACVAVSALGSVELKEAARALGLPDVAERIGSGTVLAAARGELRGKSGPSATADDAEDGNKEEEENEAERRAYLHVGAGDELTGAAGGVDVIPALHTLTQTPTTEAFQKVFLGRVVPAERYDLLFHVPLPPDPVRSAAYAVAKEEGLLQTTNGADAVTSKDKKGKKKKKKSSKAADASLHADDLAWAQSLTLKDTGFILSAASAPDRVMARLHPEEADALCDGEWATVVTETARRVLRAGLTDRIRGLRVWPCLSSTDGWPFPDRWQWPLRSTPTRPSSLWIGLRLHGVNSERIVDRGPPAEDKGLANAFRALWGSKAELRRFRDGAIVESAVWPSSVADRSGIVPRIVTHLLRWHLSIPPSAVLCPHLSLQAILERTPAPGFNASELTRWSESSATAVARTQESFARLSDALRHLSGLSAKVLQVHATDPRLRGSFELSHGPHPLAGGRSALVAATLAVQGESVHHAGVTPSKASQVVTPLDAVVVLERSSMWPDDVTAIGPAKTSILFQVQDKLNAAHGVRRSDGRSSSAGQGGMYCRVTEEALLVFLDGYVFRLSIWYPRELTLLRQVARPPSQALLSQSMTGRKPDKKQNKREHDDVAEEEDEDIAPEWMLLPAPGSQTLPGFVSVGRLVGFAPPTDDSNNGGAKYGLSTDAAGLPSARRTIAPKAAAARYLARFQQGPLAVRHAGMMRAFALRHHSFTDAVRLALFWLRAQMVRDCIATEAVELLVAQGYLDPRPGYPPNSAAQGLRSFLKLLASHPWDAQPLLVDPDAQAKRGDRRSLTARFRAVRRTAGESASRRHGTIRGPAVYLVTPAEREQGRWPPLWTARNPSHAEWQRVCMLASASLQVWSDSTDAALHPDVHAVCQSHSREMIQLNVSAGHGDVSPADCLDGEPVTEMGMSKRYSGTGETKQVQAPRRSTIGSWALGSLQSAAEGGVDVRLNRVLDPSVSWPSEHEPPLVSSARLWRTLFAPSVRDFDVILRLRSDRLPQRDGFCVSPVPRLTESASDKGENETLPRSVRDGVPEGMLGTALVPGPTTANPGAGAIRSSLTTQLTLPLFRNTMDSARDALLFGFDPVGRFLEDARERLGHSVCLFRDDWVRDVVGVQWRADTFSAAGKLGARKLQMTVLGELAKLGSGLVRDVIVVRDAGHQTDGE